MKPVVGMARESQWSQTALGHIDTKLFGQFSHQRLLRTLVRLDLSSRKFPKACHVAPFGTSGDKNAVVLVNKRASDNE